MVHHRPKFTGKNRETVSGAVAQASEPQRLQGSLDRRRRRADSQAAQEIRQPVGGDIQGLERSHRQRNQESLELFSASKIWCGRRRRETRTPLRVNESESSSRYGKPNTPAPQLKIPYYYDQSMFSKLYRAFIPETITMITSMFVFDFCFFFCLQILRLRMFRKAQTGRHSQTKLAHVPQSLQLQKTKLRAGFLSVGA